MRTRPRYIGKHIRWTGNVRPPAAMGYVLRLLRAYRVWRLK